MDVHAFSLYGVYAPIIIDISADSNLKRAGQGSKHGMGGAGPLHVNHLDFLLLRPQQIKRGTSPSPKSILRA